MKKNMTKLDAWKAIRFLEDYLDRYYLQLSHAYRTELLRVILLLKEIHDDLAD